jgi:ribosome recycling factor
MAVNELVDEAKAKMADALEATKQEFSAIRTGRANPALFSKVMVDYYGILTPLQQLASIQVPEARVVIITPHDKSQINAIEKALRESSLGVSPNNEGVMLRIILPEMTEERRNDYIKIAKQKAEEAKVQIRDIRHRAKNAIDKLVKDKDDETSEDDGKRANQELDKQTKQSSDKVEDLFDAKRKDLQTV